MQPLTCMRIMQPIRLWSQQNLKCHVDKMSKTKAILSAESSTVLFETELKLLGKEEKDMLLNSAGIRVEGLAVKASLGLPWSKFRLLSGTKHIKVDCECTWIHVCTPFTTSDGSNMWGVTKKTKNVLHSQNSGLLCAQLSGAS